MDGHGNTTSIVILDFLSDSKYTTPTMKRKELLACAVGIIIGGLLVYVWQFATTPATDPYDTAYHIHADFKIYIGDEKIDLSSDEYMTTAMQELSDHVHLHDNNGDVEHVHLEGVTFSEFLGTIKISLTNDCLIYSNETYCSNEKRRLWLFVNDALYTDSIESYIPADSDQILVYYGNASSDQIQSFLDSVTDNACLYSGTCPERGIAPPENCGLTCEL
jgi:hypothetical protein